MQQVDYKTVTAMLGNGSSMRGVLRCFAEKGAKIFVLYDQKNANHRERYFLVKYEELTIPLRAYRLNFTSSLNSLLAQTITTDKGKTWIVAKAYNLPVPETEKFVSYDFANSFLRRFHSVVVKPAKGSHGNGITVGIEDKGVLKQAVSEAQRLCPDVLIQQHIKGEDYRLLFVDYTFVAAVRRSPAEIVGDGTHTIHELVSSSNEERRKQWYAVRDGSLDGDKIVGSMSMTPLVEIERARGKAFLGTVPALGETVKLLDKANVSLGGQTEDVTDIVNTDLCKRIEKLLRSIDLPLCGVDIMSTDIASSPSEGKSFLIELNAAPGLRLHESPTIGTQRPVCGLVADALIRKYRAVQ